MSQDFGAFLISFEFPQKNAPATKTRNFKARPWLRRQISDPRSSARRRVQFRFRRCQTFCYNSGVRRMFTTPNFFCQGSVETCTFF